MLTTRIPHRKLLTIPVQSLIAAITAGSLVTGVPIAPAWGFQATSNSASAQSGGQAHDGHSHDGHSHASDKASELPPDYQPVTQQLKDASQAFRNQLKALRTAQIMYHTSDGKELEIKYRRQWHQELQPMHELQRKLLLAIFHEYQTVPESQETLGPMLLGSLKRNCDKDNYDGMLPIAKFLFQQNPESNELQQMYLHCCLSENDYEQAKQVVQTGDKPNYNLDELLPMLDRLAQDWQLELQARGRDAAGPALPRAKIKTTKGEIVIELFENDAPEAVANFISLVEDGFYEYSDFFFVEDHLLAQVGCPNEDGTGNPGYVIQDENRSPSARKLFRGSLALALLPDRANSGGSIFFIPYLPGITAENNFTVFGRVVEGMTSLANLNRVKPAQKEDSEEEKKKEKAVPDEIIEIEIINKRDHPYQPTKLQLR